MDSSQKHQSIPPIANPSLFVTEPTGKQLNRAFSLPVSTQPKRGYKKPSRPREFAKSAKKRQSVLALGSITHLQHFYAKRGIIFKPKKTKRQEEAEKLRINTNLSDLLQISEEPDEDFPPTPMPPSPPPLPTFLTSKLDIETDPDVLLANCHANIQEMLEAWCMVTGEAKADENPVPVDVLVAIETTTKTIQSVKNYSMYKEDLSDDALIKIRSAALEVLEMISELEKDYRDDDTDDSSSEDGHIYKESNYQSLDNQRKVLRKYLQIIGEYLIFDDKETYQDFSYLRTSTEENKQDKNVATITPPLSPSHPNRDWVDPEIFGDNVISRYHTFLESHRPSKSKQAADYSPLPDPNVDKAEFFAALADGKLLCVIYNTVLKRSKRPFGFIDKIHEDTSRTYRATENLKFFAAAVRFRFDVKFDEFNVSEIVKLTDTGKAHLEKALEIFCEKAMHELISTGSYKQYPLSRASSIYLQETFSNSQIQLQATANINTQNDLASAVKEKLFI